MDSPQLRIELFGGLRVRRPCGGLTEFSPRATGFLLAALALRMPADVTREELADTLYPEMDGEQARQNLRQCLRSLREAIERPPFGKQSLLAATTTSIRLNADLVVTDVSEFEAALSQAKRAQDDGARAQALDAAVRLYRSDPLPGFYLHQFDGEQTRLRSLYLRACIDLSRLLSARDDGEAAVSAALKAVRADSLSEDATAALMLAHARRGSASAVRSAFESLADRLARELNVAPSSTLHDLYCDYLKLASAIAPAAHPRPDETVAARPAPCAGIEAASAGTDAAPPSQSGGRFPDAEPAAGGVPIGSPYYVVRSTDAEFGEAVDRGDSIVLVKGPRQTGKTALLARGLERARRQGDRVVLTDMQVLIGAQLQSADTLFFSLAESIADQLGLETSLDSIWNRERGWNVNFMRFMRREALSATGSRLVWGLDEVDRLFGYPYTSEVFGLFRSWHNLRSLDPDSPFSRLTLAISYATEAHFFIADLNQSPFNVGTRLTLEDFDEEEIEDLNRRFGSPLADVAARLRFIGLVGGNPYLVRRGLQYLASHDGGADEFYALAEQENGIFGEHLRRILAGVRQDADLAAAVRAVLEGQPCPSTDSFYRLRSAGVLAGAQPEGVRFRCRLYQLFLSRHLT